MATSPSPLPLAPAVERWAYQGRGEQTEHGPCQLVYRTLGESPALTEKLERALPLLLHEFDRQEGLAPILERLGSQASEASGRPTPKNLLRRILPRLVSYRFIESKGYYEFLFEGNRASAVHVLSRALSTDYRFRLEDLSHFATHGEQLLGVLNAVGLKTALDPNAILYCPALDSPFPFKFVVVGEGMSNRKVYVSVLKALLKKTEKDEHFRSRLFRELTRGFEKFGPAAATPRFQEVELKLWRLLNYLAARLRVKAGRLTDTKDLEEVMTFLAELRKVHDALDDLIHLPDRMAARFRRRFDLELSELADQILPELERIAEEIDCDLERELSLDEKAAQVSEMRRLGSAAPIQNLAAQDAELRQAYGDVEAPPVSIGFVRTYTEAIFTGAERFDTRRYDKGELGDLGEVMSESEFELDVSMDFFGGGGDEGVIADEEGNEITVEAESESEQALDESSDDWGNAADWNSAVDWSSSVDEAWDVE